MAVKIRLARRGRAKKPFYHIVVADSRAPRDGRFIEKIGIYNPLTSPATIDLDRDKAFDWLMKGAIPTDTARSILRFNGVLYRKHLQLGVKKGAITQEVADKRYKEFIAEKDARIQKRFDKVKQEREALKRANVGANVPLKVDKVEVKQEEE
ncbi:MAG TPA: 30S ribosomal protein S16 [Bacteroidetes bacterium]|nr:30S ribosomal protein S16 [Bacteroidota bacterium]